jgi:hypothetical protein
VVSECVGAGPAAEFLAFCAMYKALPDIDQVLANPTTAPVPKEPAVLHAVIGAMVERCRAGKAQPANFARYGMRLPDEFGMLALRDALAIVAAQAAAPTAVPLTTSTDSDPFAAAMEACHALAR